MNSHAVGDGHTGSKRINQQYHYLGLSAPISAGALQWGGGGAGKILRKRHEYQDGRKDGC